MINYRAQVFPITAEDGSISWGVVFPDISCVVGGGDTPEEAINEAYQNLEYYLKDVGLHNLPQPTNPYAKEYSGKFVIRISKRLHKDLAISADNEGLSLNAFCAEALSKYVGEKSMVKVEDNLSQIKEVTAVMVNIVNVTGGVKRNGCF